MIVVIVLIYLGFVLGLVAMFNRYRHRTQKLRLEKQFEACRLVVDKYGSAKEFCDFLQTEDGEKLFNFQVDANNFRKPNEKPEHIIRRHLIRGTVCLVIGGFLMFFQAVSVVKDSPKGLATNGSNVSAIEGMSFELDSSKGVSAKADRIQVNFSLPLLIIGLGYMASAASRYYVHFRLKLRDQELRSNTPA